MASMTTGEKIKRLMERERLGLVELGKIVGVGKSRMGVIVNDQGEPLMAQLLALSRHFKVPVAYLIDPDWAGDYDPEADAFKKFLEAAERVGIDEAHDRIMNPARRINSFDNPRD